MSNYITQNELLLSKLMKYYINDENIDNMLNIINGKSKISLRIVDWFVTNYSKKNYISYDIVKNNNVERFKVYNNYKLNLKAYSKKRFDPFCRWDRITIPYKKNSHIQTTLGQLNFFKWALENKIIDYINNNYDIIDSDMNINNSSSKSKNYSINSTSSSDSSKSSDSNNSTNNKTRKKREELSQNASRGMKKEVIHTIISF